MVNVRGLVKLAAVAVALCAASATAREAPSHAGVRGLQLAPEPSATVGPSPDPDPVSPSPPVVDPTPSTTPATTTPTTPATTEPTSPSPPAPTPSTPEPTPSTTEPTVTTPAPTPSTTAPPTDPPTPAPTPSTTAPPTDPPTPAPTPSTTAPPTDPPTPAPTPSTTAPPTDPPTDPPTPAPTPSTTAPPTDPPTDPPTPAPTPSTSTPPTDPPTDPPTPAPTPSTSTPPTDPPTDPPTPAPTPSTPTPPTDPPTDPPTPAPTPSTPTPPTDPPTSEPVPTSAPPTSEPVPTSAPPTSEPVPTSAPPTSEPVPTSAPPTSEPVPTSAPPTSEPVPTSAPPTSEPVPTSAPPTSEPVPTSSPPPTTPAPTTEPPLVDVIVATEPVNTPAPSSTLKSEPTPEVNSQANKKDIITANSTEETDAPKINPFEIKVIESESPKPVVLDIGNDNSKTDEPKLYVRGEKTKAPSSSGSAEGSKTDPTANAPNVIGGSRRNTATTAESILSKSSQNFHDFLRYAAAAFSGISVALLLFFHFVSLDATLTWTSSLWSPNTWEFILYVGYLQQMASVSQLTLLKTPYYLWDYADSFAWTNFLIQRSTSSEGRRLETIVLGGVVAYADRIGIDESKIVYHAVVGFAVVLAALLVLFLIIAVFAKRKAEQALDDPLNLHHSTQSVHALRSASIRTLGLCVLIWYFALYPLSLYASFEISMEVQAKSAVASALLVSILAIGVVCFGVLAWSGRVIMQKSKEELLQFENMATWGSLYAEFSFRSRMFFILGALVQIVTGIIVGTMDSDPTQLIIVIIIEVLYLVAVFVLSPFAEMLVLRFTYALGLLKIINFSLAFAFLNSNSMSGPGRNRVANAFIGINTIVIIVWFIRQLIVFSTYIRAWSVRTSFIEETENAQEDGSAKYETRTATDSDVYASVSTARHGDGGPSVDTDDYHKAPAPREINY